MSFESFYESGTNVDDQVLIGRLFQELTAATENVH